jgi:Mlc titration factor MtfA (ptsG expression regulator)
MVLHELSHAYHDQYVAGGFRNPQIRAAWETAVEAGLYGEVLHASGEKRAAYAAGNEKEFFAELSESFFGTNDFYPFVNAELKTHDPASYALIGAMWKATPPATCSKTSLQE